MDIDKLGDLLNTAMSRREELLARRDETVVEADAGGGAVHVRMSGNHEILRLTIAPAAASAAAGDISMLEDLITAAVNEASRRANAAFEAAGTNLLEELGLPSR